MGNLHNDAEIILLAIVTTLLASGGFWAYMTNRREKTSATTRLLMGLAHDKIITNGLRAIHQGYIENQEYEDLRKYLVDPYLELGGNGAVERIMKDVSALPFVKPDAHFQAAKDSHVQLRIKTAGDKHE